MGTAFTGIRISAAPATVAIPQAARAAIEAPARRSLIMVALRALLNVRRRGPERKAARLTDGQADATTAAAQMAGTTLRSFDRRRETNTNWTRTCDNFDLFNGGLTKD